MPQDSDKLPLAELKKREDELMNCQRDKSDKGTANSTPQGCLTTLPQKEPK
jgi:hypothetical protein